MPNETPHFGQSRKYRAQKRSKKTQTLELLPKIKIFRSPKNKSAKSLK